jgi:hypothetical protein
MRACKTITGVATSARQRAVPGDVYVCVIRLMARVLQVAAEAAEAGGGGGGEEEEEAAQGRCEAAAEALGFAKGHLQ